MAFSVLITNTFLQIGSGGEIKIIYMKKILLLVFASCIYTYSNAQRHTSNDDKLDKEVLKVNVIGPAMASLEMMKELNLSQEQFEKVVLINQSRYEQLLKSETQYLENDLQRSKTMYVINLEADKALSSLLDPSQLRLFFELESLSQGRFMSGNSEE